MSRVEVDMTKWMSGEKRRSDVLDAKAQFLNKWGRWAPSRVITQAIHDAVIGLKKVSRI
jgi:hypothetical protein